LPTSSGPCSSPTLSLGCFSSKDPCWTPGPSPPPLSPNQSSPLDPHTPQTDLHHFPLVIRHPTTPAPLWTLIPIPHRHLTLPDPQRLPPCSVPEKKGGTLDLLCEGEEINAADLDPLPTFSFAYDYSPR
jgi:hypothetical protein